MTQTPPDFYAYSAGFLAPIFPGDCVPLLVRFLFISLRELPVTRTTPQGAKNILSSQETHIGYSSASRNSSIVLKAISLALSAW